MSTYSVQLAKAFMPAGQTTLFTADNAAVYVIRDVEVSNQSGAVRNIGVWLGATGFQGYLVLQPAMPTGTHVQWEGRVVMKVADVIQCFSDGAANVSVIVSGYALSN